MRRCRIGVALGAAVLAAAGAPAAAQAPPPPGPVRTPISTFTPLPAAPPVSAAARAARDRLLGDRWDDPAYATLHWTGVSSFIVTLGGHLLLFDAWEIIGATNGYTPLTRDDLAALDPEAILVGHGHFDHAGDLGLIAGRSGATVVGSDEICDVAAAGAVREGAGTGFACAITGTMDTALGLTQRFRLFADLPPVTVVQHLHSAPKSPLDGGNDLDPFLPITDLEPYITHFNTEPAEYARFLGQQQESTQGGTWMYHLAVHDFTLLLGDSAGPIKDQPAIRRALSTLPGCVDVMSNAIVGFDQPVSGLADPVDYVDTVKPKVFLPSHGDAWAPIVSAGQAQYVEELRPALAALPHPPQVDFLLDPQDYLVQRAYRVDDPRWKTAPDGSACSRATGPDRPATSRPTRPAAAPAAPENKPPVASAQPDDPANLPATGAGVPLLAAFALLSAGLLARRLVTARPRVR